MKKTVLFLMNGFGIEQQDSYSVYNSKLMPNLDSYTQKYLFSTIQSNDYNFMDGYRIFSTGSKTPLTYSLINNYMENFKSNPNMNFYINNISENSKIHLFIFLENEKSLEHLKNLLKFIREKCNNKIILHIVLTSEDIGNYKVLESIINKINYGDDFKSCKIGTVIGKNVLAGNDFVTYMNLLKNEIGEKWIEISRKFNSLSNSKIAPMNAKEFYMNDDCKITDNDIYFFFNYEYIDLTNFINTISSLKPNTKYFSMFQIKGIEFYMYAYPISGKSMASSLKSIEAKALVLSDSSYIPYINYVLNGLSNITSENISYSRTDVNFGKEQLQDIICNSQFDLIVIDYRIDTCQTIDELNKRLANLDVILSVVHDTCVNNKISLFISSLYGMKKEIKVDNFSKVYVDFSSKVPVLVIDPIFNKINFRLDNIGDVNTLANTVYTNINNKFNCSNVLIKKKGYLSKLLKK